MLSFLLECVACRASPATLAAAPLCATCAGSLGAAPPLCPACGDCRCRGASSDCLRPWARQSDIDSFHARYLLVGPAYDVLRSWKTSHGPALDRRVLNLGSELLAALQGLAPLDAIVHVPQRAERSWRLGGSPTLKLARWLSRALSVAHCPALRIAEPRAPTRRQAELGMMERLASRIEHRFAPGTPLRQGARLLLVDDFMTSGRTLRAAASALRSHGAVEVHAFCLGIRPGLHGAPEPGTLGDGRIGSGEGQPQGETGLLQGA